MELSKSSADGDESVKLMVQYLVEGGWEMEGLTCKDG